jgi:hypothetical protein
MPAGLRPFGRVRDGLKFLTVKAPRALARNILPVLTGAETPNWRPTAILRRDADRITSLDRSILDGEQFPGGNLIVSRANRSTSWSRPMLERAWTPGFSRCAPR